MLKYKIEINHLGKGIGNMQVVILAGGFGTRISEESHLKPKPMIEIGEKPILWHIMKSYQAQGFNDFIICCGYKAYVIKQYFADYYLHNCDITFDFSNGNCMEVHANNSEPWRVTLVDTGLNTMTGGRIKRIQPYVGNNPFMLTYGDGVSDININELLAFHNEHGKLATLSAINVDQRFGVLDIADNGQVDAFREKREDDGVMINAGFMVLEPQVFDYIEGDSTIFERTPLEALAKEKQLRAFRHEGFWKCMDTQRDKEQLEEMWIKGNAPWKNW